jgi:hypothetical protein
MDLEIETYQPNTQFYETRHAQRSWHCTAGARWMIVLAVACVALWSLAIQPASDGLATSDNSTLIAAFRRVEVSSVSDAIEQLIGRRMYMSHRMTPIFTTKFAGRPNSVRGKLIPKLV